MKPGWAQQVSEILTLTALSKAGARIVAGHEGVERSVDCLRSIEEGATRSLPHGALIWVSVGDLAREPSPLRQHAAGGSESAISGIIVALQGTGVTLPEDWIRDSSRCHVPLIEVPSRLDPRQAALEIRQAIDAERLTKLRIASGFGTEFARLIVDGATLQVLVQRLAQLAQNPVVLQDANGRLIEVGTNGADEEEVLALWQEHRSHRHQHLDRDQCGEEESEPTRCLWRQIHVGGRPVASLHLLEHEQQFGERARAVLSQAGDHLALAWWHQEGLNASEARDRARILTDLLQGQYRSARHLRQHAQAMGFSFAGAALVMLVCECVGDAPAGSSHAGAGHTTDGSLPFTSEQQRRIETLADSLRIDSVYSVQGAQLILGVALESEGSYRPTCIRVAAGLQQQLEPTTTGRVLVGISSQVDVSTAARGLEQAQAALAHLSQATPNRGIGFYSDLGAQRLIRRLRDDPELAEYVTDELSELVTSETALAGTLRATLRAYLDNFGRRGATARDLGIDRKTLYARLERLERLLQRNLQDAETCHRLWLALRGFDALPRQGGQSAGRGPSTSSPARESGDQT